MPKAAVDGRLVLALSMFGLAMGILTVFLIPSPVEPFLWLAIFVVCALLIARRAPSRPFLHGLLTGLLNSVWVTAAHLLLAGIYLSRHPSEAGMMAGSPLPPRVMMLLTGPLIGLASGIVLGLFAMGATRLIRRGA